MGESEHERSRQHAEMAGRTLAFLLVFPFLFGAFVTVLFFVIAVLQTLVLGGFGSVNDVLRGLYTMIPIYLIIVVAIFVGEGIYVICRKWR